ncbi:MAG: c-type cytochrome [Deltaproteobacteria bacterium]|nr:c-type cytochrome [Deltaproteobacteria bacterium]
MRRVLMLSIAASLVVSGWGCGCGSARRGAPVAGPFDDSQPHIARGKKVFEENCSQCHPGGEAGLGPAINNKPLPGFLIKFQVRKGIGAMPSFPNEHISDSELDDLVSYLKALRRH